MYRFNHDRTITIFNFDQSKHTIKRPQLLFDWIEIGTTVSHTLPTIVQSMAVAKWILALDATCPVFETTCTSLLNRLLRASPDCSTAMSFHPQDLKDNSIYMYLNSLVPRIDTDIVTDGVANMGNTSSKREKFQKILTT